VAEFVPYYGAAGAFLLKLASTRNQGDTIMMKMTDTGSGHQLEVHLTGKASKVDYDTVLIPAVEAALKDHDRLRLLFVIDQGFTGYDVAAMWADTKLGVSFWNGFERLAVVAQSGWITVAVRAFAPLMPCPVKVFALDEVDEARRWIRESLGAVHIRDLGGPALQVQLMGRPDADDFDQAEGDLDARLRQREGFRLLLDLREFDGWQGLSAIAGHFTLAREHAPLAQKVAVVGRSEWQKLAQRVAGRFLNAQSRYFTDEEFEAAKTWLTGD
jgi:stage II sporulation SpoAA-like protein